MTTSVAHRRLEKKLSERDYTHLKTLHLDKKQHNDAEIQMWVHEHTLSMVLLHIVRTSDTPQIAVYTSLDASGIEDTMRNLDKVRALINYLS